MKLYEFIFFGLGIISLIDYIGCSIIIYQCKELVDMFGINIETKIKRAIELVIIIIAILILLYKIIFRR